MEKFHGYDGRRWNWIPFCHKIDENSSDSIVLPSNYSWNRLNVNLLVSGMIEFDIPIIQAIYEINDYLQLLKLEENLPKKSYLYTFLKLLIANVRAAKMWISLTQKNSCKLDTL